MSRKADNVEPVPDDQTLLHDFADRLILGGAWTWADGGQPGHGADDPGGQDQLHKR